MENITNKPLKYIIIAISVLLSLFELYTAATIPLTAFEQRTVHIGLVFALIYLYDASERKSRAARIADYALALLCLGVNAYIFFTWEELGMRTTALTTADIVVSVLLVALVLFSTYKTVGIWMPVISCAFILYAVLGPYIPGIFHFRGISLNRALSSICLSSEGIFGSSTGVSATFVFMFLLFGEFLLNYGGGDFIMKLAQSAFGRMRGASAKIAVIASGLFGMVSGSAAANVAATGTFTIPMMKSRGYSAEYAGGIVAAATTGGLLMPPVMGTAAFLMADMLGMPYGQVCLISAIPAFLYFASLFIVADVHAAKVGDQAIPAEERPSGREVLREGWHHLISLGVLVVLLCVFQLSASKACFYGCVALLAADYAAKLLRREKLDLKCELDKLVSAFIRASKGAFAVACACACAGIIVGVFSATGLNLRFSNMLVDLAGGSQLLLLALAMIGAIILGMGLPSVSVYILMAIIVAPALVETGISVLSAHMFLFYFGSMAPITPPVGIAFYVAAGVADAKPMRTGLQAVRMALPGFILPYMFVYSPAIILQGSIWESALVALTCLVGLGALAVSLDGYYGARIPPAVRAVLFAAAILTVFPETVSTIIGVAVIVLLYAAQKIRLRRKAV